MRWSEEEYQELIKKPGYGKKKAIDRATVPPPHMEQDSGHASLGEKKIKGFDSPVVITVRSFRKRLADPDGISAKAVIDGLVKIGLLVDDSTEFVKEVRFTQEKTRGEEKTIITIEEV